MTCIQISTVSAQEATISALREQIFGKSFASSPLTIYILTHTANASILFPQMRKDSVTVANTGVFQPQEIFQVIISSSSGSSYKAILVGGTAAAMAKKAVARGPEASSVAEALAGLLKVLAEAMGWYTDTLLGDLEDAEATESGEINMSMVKDGYHFAHVERWAESKGVGRG